MTPLHLAAKSGSLRMVKLLTETGASSRKETKQEKRIPIQFAAASRHYVSFDNTEQVLILYHRKSDFQRRDCCIFFNDRSSACLSVNAIAAYKTLTEASL